jgi:hypothetical protein
MKMRNKIVDLLCETIANGTLISEKMYQIINLIDVLKTTNQEKEFPKEISIDQTDSKGYSPLMLASTEG